MADKYEIEASLQRELGTRGFEFYPFKIKWYNKQVSPAFCLPYDPDTLAYTIVSTPAVFDLAFKPFIRENKEAIKRDPFDQCLIHHFKKIPDSIGIHDFEMNPVNRRPKVLVQTAAHVSGAAYYYQRNYFEVDPWNSNTKINGVCVHPRYGGWFALRGVMIFPRVLAPELEQVCPVDVLDDKAKVKDLLDKFNINWSDWSFRNVISVKKEDQYTEDQKLYFGTLPAQRHVLLEEFLAQRATLNEESLIIPQ